MEQLRPKTNIEPSKTTQNIDLLTILDRLAKLATFPAEGILSIKVATEFLSDMMRSPVAFIKYGEKRSPLTTVYSGWPKGDRGDTAFIERDDQRIPILYADKEGQTITTPGQSFPIIKQDQQTSGELIVFNHEPLDDTARKIIEILTSIISKNETINEQMEQATHDPLTKLLNRRGCTGLAIREISRVKHTKEPLVVAFMDIDHFKWYNDRHDHDTGDIALIEMASAITKHLRAMDIVARWGGDELLAVLPATKLQQALAVMNRLRDILSTSSFHSRGKIIRFPTLSIGLASLSRADYRKISNEEICFQNLIDKGDQAVYISKENGRDQIHYVDEYGNICDTSGNIVGKIS